MKRRTPDQEEIYLALLMSFRELGLNTVQSGPGMYVFSVAMLKTIASQVASELAAKKDAQS